MLSIFLGCVNPRSYLENSVEQIADTETVIQRLSSRTAFEVEGWKRLLPVREIYKALDLDLENYELKYKVINHPFSSSILQVQSEIFQSDKIWFQPAEQMFHQKSVRVSLCKKVLN